MNILWMNTGERFLFQAGKGMSCHNSNVDRPLLQLVELAHVELPVRAKPHPQPGISAQPERRKKIGRE
jgi:hypothetical protein